MKREILFRSAHYTYDGKFKGFSYWGLINYKGEIDNTCFASPTHRNGTERKFDEQFTGSVDKNKVRIFEGDINNDKGVCFYNEDDASFCWRYGDLIAAFELESSWCTIIGNIHDNPELLNQ